MPKILLLIANRGLAERLAGMLTKRGFEVLVCEDPIRATATTRESRPDLILAATELPPLSGPQVARLFKQHEQFASIPFLLLTAQLPADEEMGDAAFRVDADDVIRLPTTEVFLIETVARWLDPERKPRALAERMAGPLALPPKTRPAKPWNKGRVTVASLGRLFHHLAERAASGTLRVQSDAGWIDAVIRERNVLDVKSSYLPEDTFGAYLVKQERITPGDVDLSFHLAQQGPYLLGNVLVERHFLEPHELQYHLRQHKLGKLVRVFSPAWRDAAFEFVAAVVDDAAAAMEPIPVHHVLVQGIFHEADDADLLATFQRAGKEDIPLRPTPRAPEILQDYALETEWRDRARAAEHLSVRGLRETFQKHAGPYVRAAFFLVVTRAAQFADQSGERAPRPAPAPVPDEAVVSDERARPAPAFEAVAFARTMSEGGSLLKRGEYEPARSLLTKALEMNPDSSLAMAMLAWANYHLGGTRNREVQMQAKDMLKTAISLDDTNDVAMVYLGKILKDEGKDGLAATYFRNAYDANPANEEAQREVLLLQVKKRKDTLYGYRK